MSTQKKNRISDSELDRIGRSLTRAATAPAEEIESAAAAPFLYGRIKAGIRAEQEKRAASEWWKVWLFMLPRAVPLMLIIVVTSILMLYMGTTTNQTINLAAGTAQAAGEDEFDRVVFNDNGTPLTRDQVLATLIGEDENAGGAH